jgi:hypothetical protein
VLQDFGIRDALREEVVEPVHFEGGEEGAHFVLEGGLRCVGEIVVKGVGMLVAMCVLFRWLLVVWVVVLYVECKGKINGRGGGGD